MTRRNAPDGGKRRPITESRNSLAELQKRLAEAEDTLNAIRSGAVDALVVRTPQGEQLFTLKGRTRPIGPWSKR